MIRWATFDPTSRTFAWTPGVGKVRNHTVNFNVAANTSASERESGISVAGYDMLVIQAASGPQNTPPTISPITDTYHDPDGIDYLTFNVGDQETDPSLLTVSVRSVPESPYFDMQISDRPDLGSGGRMLEFIGNGRPVSDTGYYYYEIIVTVSDGELTTSTSFELEMLTTAPLP